MIQRRCGFRKPRAPGACEAMPEGGICEVSKAVRRNLDQRGELGKWKLNGFRSESSGIRGAFMVLFLAARLALGGGRR